MADATTKRALATNRLPCKNSLFIVINRRFVRDAADGLFLANRFVVEVLFLHPVESRNWTLVQ
jgi:hypothetical protein